MVLTILIIRLIVSIIIIIISKLSILISTISNIVGILLIRIHGSAPLKKQAILGMPTMH